MTHGLIMRLVVQDARRFEIGETRMLQELRATCTDDLMRKALDEILSEEQGHLRELDELAGHELTTTELKEEMPGSPGTGLPCGDTRAKLREFLKREEAAVTFYELLAARSPLPPVRRVFKNIAAAERAHVEKMTRHIRRICEDEGSTETTR